MYPKIIFSLVIIFFLSSCGNRSTSPIELNNGEKWKVNTEMMPPLKASEKLITEFVTTHKKDYKSLAENLKINNELLISSCTMKGKSHEELHKWLHPYMGLIEELSNADDESNANEIVLKIQTSFKTFNQHFQ